MNAGWPVELDAFLAAVAAGLDRPVLAALDVLGRGDAEVVLETLEASRPTVFGEPGLWRILLHATGLNESWSVVVEVVRDVAGRGWAYEARTILDVAVRRPVPVSYPIATSIGSDGLALFVDRHHVTDIAAFPTVLMNETVLMAVSRLKDAADLARFMRLLREQSTGVGTWGVRYLVGCCEGRPDLPEVAAALRSEGLRREARQVGSLARKGSRPWARWRGNAAGTDGR